MPWSARLVRASGSGDRVGGGGAGKGRESRRVQAPQWRAALVPRLPQGGRGIGGRAARCTLGFVVEVALGQRPAAVHGGSCSRRSAEVKDAVMRGARPGAAGPREQAANSGAALTPDCRAEASGLARRPGAGAVPRGDWGAVPRRGAAAAPASARGLPCSPQGSSEKASTFLSPGYVEAARGPNLRALPFCHFPHPSSLKPKLLPLKTREGDFVFKHRVFFYPSL